MTDEQAQTLRDMASFITWSLTHAPSYKQVLITLHHDSSGLLAQEPCFLPRTTGYQTVLAKS